MPSHLPARIRRASERLLPASKRHELEERRRAEREEAAERKRLARVEQRRTDLLAGDTELRRFDLDGVERIGRVVTRFTADEASAHNLRLVTAALDQAEVSYFLVPGNSPTRYVVGVERWNKKTALEALRELYRTSPLYTGVPGPKGVLDNVSFYVDGALPDEVKAANTLRFGELLLGPQEQLLGGVEFGCDVEFWRSGDQISEEKRAALHVQAPDDVLGDALVAPRGNQVSDVLATDARKPASRTVQGRDYPTFVPFTQPRVDEVTFPIDAVYTWVDGSDPEHAAKRQAHRSGGSTSDTVAHATADSRYTDHDELKYSLRSLQMYGGFVRHVYIVTDGQVPPWLDTSAPGVTVVDHRDIIPADALPVFNSHAISSRLHHIPGLSERYVYLNDDIFLGRPVTPDRLFHANGIARVAFSPYQLGLGVPHPEEPAPNSAGKNVRDLLQEEHGRFITHKFKHVPHPQVKSVMRELEERFPEDFERTFHARFRSLNDIAPAAIMHHHHALLSGRAVPGNQKLRYVDIGAPDAWERIADIEESRGYEFFCLNDVNTPQETQERIAGQLHAFLERYFPFPSTFER